MTKSWLSLIVVAIVFRSLLLRIVFISKNLMVLWTLNFENAFNIIEEVGLLIDIVLLQKHFNALNFAEIFSNHEFLDLMLGLKEQNTNKNLKIDLN